MSEHIMVKVAVTGAQGFLGRHLLDRLQRESAFQVVKVGREDFADAARLRTKLIDCSLVVHCAGVNRGEPALVESGNVQLAERMVAGLDTVPVQPRLIIYTSSIQETLDNPYGRGKLMARKILMAWGKRRKVPVASLVIPNVFGDGGRPFYNSMVATFCHQVARGEEPKIIEDRRVPLVYVNRVVEQIYFCLQNPMAQSASIEVKPDVEILVSEVLCLLRHFHEALRQGTVPALKRRFELELYHTFRAALGAAALEWRAESKSDSRGTLFEVIKQEGAGQVFFSITKPGITRGNHYHTRKVEKFCVVQGEAVIRLRRIGTSEVLEFPVSGNQPAAVEMPAYYTHHIENTGPGELVTLFWCNEIFDAADPDTFHEEVCPASMPVTIVHPGRHAESP